MNVPRSCVENTRRRARLMGRGGAALRMHPRVGARGVTLCVRPSAGEAASAPARLVSLQFANGERHAHTEAS